MDHNHAGSATGIDLSDVQNLPMPHFARHPEYRQGYAAALVDVAALARATPQHSVTEQASIDCDAFWILVAEVERAPAGKEYQQASAALVRYITEWADSRAQPLASTAAQPEQASEILGLHRRLAAETLRADHGWQRADAKSKECIELRERAALAIPASTAAERHALRDGYAGGTLVSDFAGPKITLRYATTTQAEAAHVVLCAMIDGPAASEQQADHLNRAAQRVAIAANGYPLRPDDFDDVAASEQQAGADERALPSADDVLSEIKRQQAGATFHFETSRGAVERTLAAINTLNAALTHRAITAPVIPQCRHCDVEPGEVHHGDCPDRVERMFMPAYRATTAADQQGDTTSAPDQAAFEVQARHQGASDFTPADNMQCSNGWFPATYESPITELAWRVWANKRGSAQVNDAPALMRGAVASVGHKRDGIIGINWMRPERVEKGDLLYVVDRAAMQTPAASDKAQ